jgi:hypothetical protein
VTWTSIPTRAWPTSGGRRGPRQVEPGEIPLSGKSAPYLHPERTASANEIRNELAASRRVPPPVVDEPDDDLPSRQGLPRVRGLRRCR